MTLPAVLILFNRPRPAGAGNPAWQVADAGVLVEVAAIEAALKHGGAAVRTVGVRRLDDIPVALNGGAEEIVFNLVEALEGELFDACLVPAVCEAMGRGCTGNGAVCQVAALDKWQTKHLLAAFGVTVPEGVVIPAGTAVDPARFAGRAWIVKPLRSDASEGIDADALVPVGDHARVAIQAARVHAATGQPALVEAYIAGREINVTLIERKGSVELMPLAEIDFSGLPAGTPHILDYNSKWVVDSVTYRNTPLRIPVGLDEPAAEAVRAAARRAWEALGCRDYARVDLRVDATGRPFALEVNPNPDVSPEAGFAAALHAGGVPFEAFVAQMVKNAGARLKRVRAPEERLAAATAASTVETKAGKTEIRWSEKADIEPVISLVDATGVFHSYEVDVAREIITEAVAKGASGHYQSYTALVGPQVAGWVCIGPTPCTRNTYDVYWLAVDPRIHGKGVGRALMHRAEAEIMRRGGRISVVETGGREAYKVTRAFYLRCDYVEEARIADFYAAGDDKVVYIKRLDPGEQA
ncbi:MAG: GNAT family N-acetyltransferase [Planctomycetota bacterium]